MSSKDDSRVRSGAIAARQRLFFGHPGKVSKANALPPKLAARVPLIVAIGYVVPDRLAPIKKCQGDAEARHRLNEGQLSRALNANLDGLFGRCAVGSPTS